MAELLGASADVVGALRARVMASPYASCYCEENVYQLLVSLRRVPDFRRCFAVFIGSQSPFCPVWCQRSARRAEEPVMWDYHVVCVVLARGRAYACDLDTRLDVASDARRYVDAALGPADGWPAEARPRVRVVAAETFLDHFASDRSHMLRGGTYSAPPPAWPRIRGPRATGDWNLDSFVDTTTPLRHRGTAMDLASFRSWLSEAAAAAE